MSQKVWVAVDHYLESLLIPPDPVLDAAIAASTAAGLPEIAVSPSQGKQLHLLARMMGARRILEIGTLGGYSTIWLARALTADGQVVTLEIDPKHFEVARNNLAHAGLSDKVEQRLGAALEVLPQIEAENRGPFDLVFIDADKENNAAYFDWAVRLSRPGTAIVVDNVIRDGKVVNAKSRDPRVQGVRRFYDALAADQRVTATTIQTVGVKGYDGFTLALVNG